MDFIVATLALAWLGAGLPDESTEIWQMRLSEAIQIGLDNHEKIRVVSLRHPIPIANCFGDAVESRHGMVVVEGVPGGCVPPADHPLSRADRRGSPDVISWAANVSVESPERLRSEAETLVRLVEKRYWILAQKHVSLWIQDQTRELLEEIQRDRLPCLEVRNAGGAPAVDPKIEQELERCRVGFAARALEVLNAERQLREALGLPREDHRRILPVSTPGKPSFEARWDDSWAQMLRSRPDVVSERNRLVGASVRFVAIRVAAYAAMIFSHGSFPRSLQARSTQALAELDEQRVRCRRVVLQASDTLSRSLERAEAAGRQLATATQRADAAERTLNETRESYEAGRITAALYLEAMHRLARTLEKKGEFQAEFQDSLAAFEQAKGTLLNYDNITLLNEVPAEPEH